MDFGDSAGQDETEQAETEQAETEQAETEQAETDQAEIEQVGKPLQLPPQDPITMRLPRPVIARPREPPSAPLRENSTHGTFYSRFHYVLC